MYDGDDGRKKQVWMRPNLLTDSLSRDSAFEVVAQGIRKGNMAETWTKKWPILSKLEMPNMPWFNLGKDIQGLIEIEMLERIWDLPSPTLGVSKRTPFSSTVRNMYKFVRESPAFLKSSMMALICEPDLTVGSAVTELGNLNEWQ